MLVYNGDFLNNPCPHIPKTYYDMNSTGDPAFQRRAFVRRPKTAF